MPRQGGLLRTGGEVSVSLPLAWRRRRGRPRRRRPPRPSKRHLVAWDGARRTVGSGSGAGSGRGGAAPRKLRLPWPWPPSSPWMELRSSQSGGLGPADKGVVQVRGQHCTAAPHLFPFPKSRVAATSFTERHLLAVWKQTGPCRSSKCSKCKSHTKAQSAISNCETNTFQS